MWSCVVKRSGKLTIPATKTEEFALVWRHLPVKNLNSVSVFGIFSQVPPCPLYLPYNKPKDK